MNLISWICSSVFLITVLTAQGNADEHFPFLAKVSKASVNIRAGANTNFEKLDQLTQGAEVVVIGRNFEWLKIQEPATGKAFIRADYLKIKEGGSIAEIVGDRVNVRASASSEASSLGQLKNGALVKVIEKVNEWQRIEPPSEISAWVHQDFLVKVSDEIPAGMIRQSVAWTPPVPKEEIKKEEPLMILKGRLEFVSATASSFAYYKISVDGQGAYSIEDMPQLSRFNQAVVDVQALSVADPQKKFPDPLIKIYKISLVL